MFTRVTGHQLGDDRASWLSYAEELTFSMHSTSLEILGKYDQFPRIATVQQLYNYPTTCGYRLIDLLKDQSNYAVDLVAAVARNLFESTVTMAYLNENNMQDFEKRISQMVLRDHYELVKASLVGRLPNDPGCAEARAEEKRLDALKLPKHLHISDLAKRCNFESEYQNYYKIFCKYVHPSLYLLIGDQRVVYSSVIYKLIVIRALFYLERFANNFLLLQQYGDEAMQRIEQK
jgi:hypothetical protein